MTIYHARHFEDNIDLYCNALRLIAQLDYDNALRTSHFCARTEERGINLNKISANKIAHSEIFEVKAEQEKIISVGIRVSYNKKKVACIVIGFNSRKPQIITAWFDDRR